VNAKANDGRTPLDLVIRRPEIADLLRKHDGKTRKEPEAAGKPTAPVAEVEKPEPPTAKAPDISMSHAAFEGNIKAINQHLQFFGVKRKLPNCLLPKVRM